MVVRGLLGALAFISVIAALVLALEHVAPLPARTYHAASPPAVAPSPAPDPDPPVQPRLIP